MATVPRSEVSRSPIYYGLIGNQGSNYVDDYRLASLLVSEGHYRLKNGGWSGGGPFYVWKRKLNHHGYREEPITKMVSGVNGVYAFAGVDPLDLKLPQPVPAPPPWLQEKAALEAWHATGVNRTKPDKPVGGLGQFLKELNQLPQLPLKKFRKGLKGIPFQKIPSHLLGELLNFRRLGGEYLNFQFGWLPFVKDVQQMYYLWHDIDKRLAQIARDNGKGIRRGTTLENESSSVQTVQNFNWAFANVNGSPFTIPGTTYYTDTRVTKTRVWFSGKYRYYIPDVGSSQWSARTKAALFGVVPTPELLYNVVPWTWLIDYFSNAGDVISNVYGNGVVSHQIIEYAYVMKHTIERRECKSITEWAGFNTSGTYPSSMRPGKATFYSILEEEKKMRSGSGNPFGLNVGFSSLSTGQLGILAALGLSKGAVD